MIKAVLFDLDGTLLDRDSTMRLLLRDQYTAFAAHLGHLDREVFVTRVLVLDDHGHGQKKAALYASIVEEFNLPATLAADLLDHFWGRYHAFCRPFANVVPTSLNCDAEEPRSASSPTARNGSSTARSARSGFLVTSRWS